MTRAAENLLAEMGATIPVDVERIARMRNADYRERPLSSELSGLMQRTDGGVIIAVNANHPTQRKRFTLAHELGHWLLDHGDSVVDTVRRRDAVSAQGTSVDEMEANQFAADLLMPAAWIKRELDGRVPSPMHVELIEEMAHRFDVSVDAMTIRLTNLGLLAS